MIKNYVTFLFLFLSVFLFAQEDKEERIDTINTTPTQLKSQEILNLKVFPNPVSDGILRIKTPNKSEKTIRIFDVLGEQVFFRKMTTEHVSISNLKPGVYILRVSELGKVASRKLVIR